MKSNELRLFELACQKAAAKVGDSVFYFQPLVIQQGLIAREILTILNAQDEEISDSTIRRLVPSLDSMLSDWGEQ